MRSNLLILASVLIVPGLIWILVFAISRWMERAEKILQERDTCKKCGWSKKYHIGGKPCPFGGEYVHGKGQVE